MISHTRASSFSTVAFLLFLGSFPLYVHGSNTSGWFHPIVENFGPVGSCLANEALVDVALKEHSFYTNADPTGVSLRLRVLNKTTGALVGDTGTVTGDTVSGTLCFNPADHALLPTVGDSTTYHQAGRVALSFRPSPTRPLLHGNHVRGYMHLLRKDAGSPNISHVYPGVLPDDVNINTGTPTFQIWNHMITPTYDSTSATTTSVYVRNLTSGTLTPLGTFPTPTATGLSEMTPATSLGDGRYQWFYHQELNGVARVDFSDTPVDFVGFPVSSLSGRVTFRVDTVNPSISTLSFPVYTRAADDSYVDAQARVTVRDHHSGLRTASLTVYDAGGTLIDSVTRVFGGTLFRTTDSHWVTTPSMQLNAGETYRIVANALDDAGNLYEREFFHTVTIPPLITLRTPHEELSPPTNVRLRAEVTAEGSSPIMERRICWRTTDTDIINSGNCGTPFPSGTVGEVFSRDIGPLTTPGLYYYQAWVTNAQGLTAVSGVSSFLIGTPSPGVSCSTRRRCINTTTSQLYVCYSAFPGHATGYEAAYCNGDTPCLDPNDTSTYTSLGNVNNTWVTVPEKGARYYVYARAQYASGWSNWAQLYHVDSYWCLPPDPVSPTLDSQNWTGLSGTGPGEYQVTLRGRVTSDGGAPLTWRGTCWGTDPAIINNCEQDGGLDVGSVYNHVRTNIPEQRIYFQARAQNSAGHVGRSSPMSFVPGAVAPTLVDLFTWDVGINSASIRATIVDDGGAPITYRNVRFCKGEGCNLWSGFHTCGSNDTRWVNVPPQIDFVRQCTGSNYGPILVPTYFRYAVCAVNLNNLPGCLTGYFIVDPDSITSEGGGAGTFLPQ